MKKNQRVQIIPANPKKGTPEKTILHSTMSEIRKRALFKMWNDSQLVISKLPLPRPKPYLGYMIWNSTKRGTYVKAIHGEIGINAKRK